MLPHAQLIGNSANCQNLSVLCGRRVSLTVIVFVDSWPLTQTFPTKGDSLGCYLREKTLVSSRAGHVRIVRSAFAQKTHVLRTVILATCSNQYRQQQQIPSTVSCSDEKWHSRRVPLSLVRVGNLRASLDYRNNVPLLILIVKLMWFSKPRGEVIAHFS